jgi:diguanylate cyclase (GGDEF)-like protein/PAS domain S-box-containing protein
VSDQASLTVSSAREPRKLPASAFASAPIAGSEAYFRSLVENARDVIHVINADRTTRYISPSIERLLGYTPEELVGRGALDLLHPDDREAAVEQLRRTPDAPEAGRPIQVRVRHRDGSWRIFEGIGRNLLDDPVVQGIIVNSRDVTRRRANEEELERLAAFPRESPNPILRLDRAGAVTYANPAALRLAAELDAAGPEALLPPAGVLAACGGGGGDCTPAEVELGGRTLRWSCHADAAQAAVHLFGEEVTESKEAEARLLHQALHDPLTGLPNRHLFMERLGTLLTRAHLRENRAFAVLYIDLDRFKVVNDSLGHHAGDQLLMAVAGRLTGSLRATDTVARFGGDEFAVLLEDLESPDNATHVAERITSVLAAPVNLGGYEVFTSASIGIALSSTGHDRPEYLLRNADVAMYRAKGAGANRYEVFDRGMHAQALARLQMETDLRRALANDEFRLRFQPIISLATGGVSGFEALLRWQHPERGLMPPGEFVPLAEETGVIIPLGEWVLRQACASLARWRADFPGMRLVISVNISARQFTQRDLVARIARAVDDAGLLPRHLKLEITESAVLDRAGDTGTMLQALKEMGVQVQMDDFGTGYSSLSTLHHVPVDGLKVDQSFIARMEDDPATCQLVRTIAAMARGLELAVIAEGVETAHQLREVREMGCDYAQGYLIARPLDDEGVREFLARDPRF